MFNLSVNRPYINDPLSAARIGLVTKEQMHIRMKRVYYAVLQSHQIRGAHPQTELAALLQLTSQVVNNWEKRGPSPLGLLQIQQATGVNATWVCTGTGPMFISGTVSPTAARALAALDFVPDASQPHEALEGGRSAFSDFDEAPIERKKKQ